MNKVYRPPIQTLLINLAVLAALGACASRNAPSIALRSLDSYALRQEQSDIVAVAEPHFTPAKSEQAFSVSMDFIDEGVFPIQIIVRNQGGNDLFVSRKNIRLSWPGETGIPPTSSVIIYQQVKASEAMRAAFGLIGAMAVRRSDEARLNELTARDLKDALVSSGDTLSGFLYFVPPRDAEIKEAALDLSILDIDANEEINFRIGVPSHYFEEIAEIRKQRTPALPKGSP